MKDKFIDTFSRQIINSGLTSWWGMRGCWEWEIRDLEKYFDVKLPTLYRSFLKKMGRGAGKFMQGTGIFYKHLYDNRKAIEEVLELDGHPFTLTKETFIFSSHQGYIFYFFDTASDFDDPPVFGYGEGDLERRLVDQNFSTFLLGLFDEQKRGWAPVKLG